MIQQFCIEQLLGFSLFFDCIESCAGAVLCLSKKWGEMKYFSNIVVSIRRFGMNNDWWWDFSQKQNDRASAGKVSLTEKKRECQNGMSSTTHICFLYKRSYALRIYFCKESSQTGVLPSNFGTLTEICQWPFHVSLSECTDDGTFTILVLIWFCMIFMFTKIEISSKVWLQNVTVELKEFLENDFQQRFRAKRRRRNAG
jgi:hypothetical protein